MSRNWVVPVVAAALLAGAALITVRTAAYSGPTDPAPSRCGAGGTGGPAGRYSGGPGKSSPAARGCANALAEFTRRTPPSAGGKAPNGCGPPNSLAPPGLVPQRPFGADFKAVCDEHDRCYGRLGASKDVCDKQFADGLRRESERLGSPNREACGIAAFGYAKAVEWWGQRAFDEAQK